MVSGYRAHVGTVFDPGAGDGRFAASGKYDQYTGYELDKSRKAPNLPSNAKIVANCAFSSNDEFDLCIGNPPYVRHHDIDDSWQKIVAEIVELAADKRVSRLSNAFLYFMWQGLFRTKPDGLLAMIVPFEWVSRPSAKSLREYINENKWNVDVYRFKDNIFPRVMTTASLTVVDKAKRESKWRYYSIDSSFEFESIADPHLADDGVLEYRRSRADVYAKRGLSPGTQRVFLLTEGERIHFGLTVGRDVVPAVSTLRHVPASLRVLNKSSFNSNFVDAGRRCWLINPYPTVSSRLKEYLSQVSKADRDTWTCRQRDNWWAFVPDVPPAAIFSAGFTENGPRFIENHVRAIAVGGVCGIHLKRRASIRPILDSLRAFNFESRVVHHSNSLKKVEIGQMNAVLSQLLES